MIKNHLSKLLGEQRMSQAKLARLTGIRPATINELYHEIAERISVEQIDKICEVLGCSVGDLFEYIPNAQPTTGSHLIVEEHGNRKNKNN